MWLGSFVQADGPPGAFVLMIQLYAIFGEKYSKFFFQKNIFFFKIPFHTQKNEEKKRVEKEVRVQRIFLGKISLR